MHKNKKIYVTIDNLAIGNVNLFEGLCYITPIIGALLADSYLGKYKTIVLASSIYLVGMILLTLSAAIPLLHPISGKIPPTAFQYFFLTLSLVIIALGTGGIKPVVSVFGADQFDESKPHEKVEKASFFNWFYFVINVGSLIASTVLVYIQENKSWALGFAIPTLAMFFAIICFVSGYRIYKHTPRAESPIVRVGKVVYTALKNRYILYMHKKQIQIPEYQILVQQEENIANQINKQKQNGMINNYDRSDNADLNDIDIRKSTISLDNESFDNSNNSIDKKQNSTLNKGLQHFGQKDEQKQFKTKKQKQKWLNWAIYDVIQDIPYGLRNEKKLRGYTYQEVQEVRLVFNLIPYFVYMIFYWLIFQQMSTMFILQGQYMYRDVHVFGRDIRIPSAMLGVFNVLGIIILIPLYDKVIIPFLRKCNKAPTVLQRIGWGFVVAALAMLYTAIIEFRRLQIVYKNKMLPQQQQLRNLNIFWLAGGYLLVGFSEILSSIGSIEFFYDEAPNAMRSTASALSLLSTSFGSFMASFLVSFVQKVTSLNGRPGWLSNDLNEGRLDLFYILCAILQLVSLGFFIWSSWAYEYLNSNLVTEQVKSIENLSEDAQYQRNIELQQFSIKEQ